MNKFKQALADLRASLWFVPGVMIVFSVALAMIKRTNNEAGSAPGN